MEERKKTLYVSPSTKVYVIEPTQILAGSIKSSTSVNDWEEGVDLGSFDTEENFNN